MHKMKRERERVVWFADDPNNPNNKNQNQGGSSSSSGGSSGGDGGNKPKCSKCGNDATTELDIKDEEGKISETLILCDACCKKEMTCQECQKETTGKMTKANKNGSTIQVCEECHKKVSEQEKITKELKAKIDKIIFHEKNTI